MALHDISTGRQTQWEIEPENSTVEFTIGWSPLHRAHGRFAVLGGSVAALSDREGSYRDVAGELDIDANSVDTGIKLRDTHLHNALFLDVERFPAISFVSEHVEELGQNRYRVVGDLSIKGAARQIALEVTTESGDDGRVHVIGGAALDRRDFNIGPKTMGVMVGNRIAVHVALMLHAR